MRKTKRLKNKAQQSKKFRNKKNPEKYQEQTVKPYKKLTRIFHEASKIYSLKRDNKQL